MIWPPTGTGAIERGPGLVQCVAGEPRLKDRYNLVPGCPTRFLFGEIEIEFGAQCANLIFGACCLLQGLPVARRKGGDHDPSSVTGSEVASEGTVDLVPRTRPVVAIDLDFANIAEMT